MTIQHSKGKDKPARAPVPGRTRTHLRASLTGELITRVKVEGARLGLPASYVIEDVLRKHFGMEAVS